MTRVCHLITRMILGGAQENTLLTLDGLKRDTPWDLHLACGPEFDEGSLLNDVEACGIKVHRLKHLRRNLHPLSDLRAYQELRNFFRREKFDLVHTHSSKAGILGRFAARAEKVPVIVHTIHGLAFDEYQHWLKSAIYRLTEKAAAQRCDRIVTVSSTLARRAEMELEVPASRISVIHSGFDLHPYSVIPDWTPRKPFTLGLIARMFALKGHEDLLALIPSLLDSWPDMRILVIGDGPLRPVWDRWLIRHPKYQERIVLTGRVFRQDIPNWISQMDALLHLSWREGLPRTVAQAMAGGKPVIAYDVGGTRDIVINQRTGWLVEPGNKKSVISALSELRSNPEKTWICAREGRKRAMDLFSVERMQKEILNLYRQLGVHD